MNKTRWFWASVVSFVVFMVLDYIFNNICLAKIYQETAALWRPFEEIKTLMPWGWLTTLIFSFFFAFIYTKGCECKGSKIAEGFRYGLVIGIPFSLVMASNCYLYMPVPVKLAFYWFIMGLFEFVVAGIFVGLIYKCKPEKAGTSCC